MSKFQVCLNAWVYYSADGRDYNQTYTDDHATADGWSVYVRTDPAETGEFDVPEDHDVRTRDEALSLAAKLAKKYGTTDIREF